MIRLPYPPVELNPNNRSCWQKKARKAKTYKNDCWISLLPFKAALKGKTQFLVTFCPPNNNRRDVDNAVASLKSGIDMLAKAAGVDDSKFQITYAMGESVQYGAVLVVPA
jgi:crossover junction endodeoxyribonuclease RusA